MDKLQGIDIFLFKAYLEKTGSVDTTFWVVLTEFFCNLLFGILNLLVLMFSTVIDKLESFSLYDLYKDAIYDTSKELWEILIGEGDGKVASGSILMVLLGVMGLYLFLVWASGRQNFSKAVLRTLSIIILGFSYFGTIQGTKGGLFVLDGIRDLSNEALQAVNKVTIEFSPDKNIKASINFKDSYIEQTSYQAYLYVNTGRDDGKFYNNKTEKLEELDNSRALGQVGSDGKFEVVSTKDRADYFEELGHGAKDNKERNRWVSAVGDFFVFKLLYVLSSIVKACVIPIPHFVIHLFRIFAELITLIFILGFPFVLIFSFIPRIQNYLIGAVKLMLISGVLPTIGSFMILAVAFINEIISSQFENIFSKDSPGMLVVGNFAFAIMTFVIYYGFWKGRGFVLSFFSGENISLPSGLGREVGRGADREPEDLTEKSKNFYHDYSQEHSPEELTIIESEEMTIDTPEAPDEDLPIVETPEISEVQLPEENAAESNVEIPQAHMPEEHLPDLPESSDVEIFQEELPEISKEEPLQEVDVESSGVEMSEISNTELPEISDTIPDFSQDSELSEVNVLEEVLPDEQLQSIDFKGSIVSEDMSNEQREIY